MYDNELNAAPHLWFEQYKYDWKKKTYIKDTKWQPNILKKKWEKIRLLHVLFGWQWQYEWHQKQPNEPTTKKNIMRPFREFECMNGMKNEFLTLHFCRTKPNRQTHPHNGNYHFHRWIRRNDVIIFHKVTLNWSLWIWNEKSLHWDAFSEFICFEFWNRIWNYYLKINQAIKTHLNWASLLIIHIRLLTVFLYSPSKWYLNYLFRYSNNADHLNSSSDD